MKHTNETKQKAAVYIAALKNQVEVETGMKFSVRPFRHLQQAYEQALHEKHRACLLFNLSEQAKELGFRLVPA